jgi:hypothetical protein
MASSSLPQTPYDANYSILDPSVLGSRYNGRVNIINPPNPYAKFQMQEKYVANTKITSYKSAMDGIYEKNALSQAFFSGKNVQAVQNGLRDGVYAASKNQYVIPPQNQDNVKIIMRSIFLQYAEFRPEDIPGQVERLNSLVYKQTVPTLLSECVSYLKYLQDQSTLVVPLALPTQNDRDYKQLELPVWF